MNDSQERFEDVLTIEYAGALVRLFTRRTGSLVFDEDLIQDVLLRGVVAWRRNPEIKYPRAFFGKIARDVVSDHWRRRRTTTHTIEEGHFNMMPTIETEIDGDRRLVRLRQAIRNLSETDRRLIELVYFEDHSLSALTNVFEKSESALKMKM